MKEKLAKFYENEVNVPAVGYFWKGFALFLLGVVVGFLVAPIKKGVSMGCNNGNNNGNNCSATGNELSVGDDEETEESGKEKAEENAED